MTNTYRVLRPEEEALLLLAGWKDQRYPDGSAWEHPKYNYNVDYTVTEALKLTRAGLPDIDSQAYQDIRFPMRGGASYIGEGYRRDPR